MLLVYYCTISAAECNAYKSKKKSRLHNSNCACISSSLTKRQTRSCCTYSGSQRDKQEIKHPTVLVSTSAVPKPPCLFPLIKLKYFFLFQLFNTFLSLEKKPHHNEYNQLWSNLALCNWHCSSEECSEGLLQKQCLLCYKGGPRHQRSMLVVWQQMLNLPDNIPLSVFFFFFLALEYKLILPIPKTLQKLLTALVLPDTHTENTNGAALLLFSPQTLLATLATLQTFDYFDSLWVQFVKEKLT